MKRSRLVAFKEWWSRKSKQPWACFETGGPDEDGRVEFSISCNKAFIANLRSQGYEGMTDEEIVQMFFVATRIIPEHMIEDEESVNPEATPRLSSDSNILKR